MKALKTLLVPSSPPSTKSGTLCGYCKKKFKPACPGDLCCSVQCARKLEWDALAAEHARRFRSQGRTVTSPPDPDSLIRRAVMESARNRQGTPPDNHPHARDQSSFETEHCSGLRESGLSRNNSMPERRRHRMVSHHTPRTPPPPPPRHILLNAGHTPARPSQPLRMPDEQCSYRSGASSPRGERRYERAEAGGRSGTSSPTLWTSSPTSSSPTLVSHSPTAARPGQGNAKTSASPPEPSALSRVGRHNKSSSDLLFSASPIPSSPGSYHMFPIGPSEEQSDSSSSSSSTTKSNALGLAVKPFLVRAPSHPPSWANRKKTLDGDSEPPLGPKSLLRPGPGPERTPGSVSPPPHPRYRNGALELRPGYGRREPRPRSNSFGGFLSLKTSRI